MDSLKMWYLFAKQVSRVGLVLNNCRSSKGWVVMDTKKEEITNGNNQI